MIDSLSGVKTLSNKQFPNNINTIVENYLYTKSLDLDLLQQKSTAYLMYDYIKNNFLPDATTDYSGQSTMTTQLYAQYNYLLYPHSGIVPLYKEIRQAFYEINPDANKNDWMIQCWLNFYRAGEFIDWHMHWDAKFEVWHGFYCVDVEPNSATLYKVPPNMEDKDIITITSMNNLLVLGKSDGDYHRSTEWPYHFPRITIAFDIIKPEKLIEANGITVAKNHWIPLV
mgnify:FL=1